MSRIAEDAARLADALAGMTGAEAWSVQLGVGSFLTIDLGEPVEDRYPVRGPEKTRIVGQWELWVQVAAWRLEDMQQVLVACEDPRAVIVEKIAVLRGRRVTAVTVTPPALETVFDFDGVRLCVFPVHSAPPSASGGSVHTQWSLWRPQADIVSVRPGSGTAWIVESSKRGATKKRAPEDPPDMNSAHP